MWFVASAPARSLSWQQNDRGSLTAGAPASEVAGLQQGRKLLRVVERWLRSDLEASRREEAADPSLRGKRPGAVIPRTTPLMPTKHMMFFRG